MQHIVEFPNGAKLQLNYSKSVYSPKYSSTDTILIVDKLIKDGKKFTASVLDVGCGSGVIGLGVKTLNPLSNVTLCDIDSEAIKVSRANARKLKLKVAVYRADMVPKLGFWDIIVSNLPTYSDEDMEQELHGPKLSYYAGKDPLHLYDRLFSEALGRCRFIVCECQAKYQKRFLKLAEKRGWVLVLKSEFGFAFM